MSSYCFGSKVSVKEKKGSSLHEYINYLLNVHYLYAKF